MTGQLENADLRILRQLQKDCRRSVADIAEACALSKSACHRRIQNLQDAGVINGYTAVLNADALGFTLMFVVDVRLKGQSDEEMRAFESAISVMPEVLECQLMTGANDYVLRVASKSVSDYEDFHHRLARLPSVATVMSSLALRTVKPWAGLPV